jgi:hypothetical protein
MEQIKKEGRKRIACDGNIAIHTMNRLKLFTNMSISEVNDRLIEGKGIVTHDDQEVLTKAKSLRALLRKVAFPGRLSSQLQAFFLSRQTPWSNSLTQLISILENGCKPIYFYEEGNKKYKKELDTLGEPMTHTAIQKGFDLVLRDIQGYVNSGFIKSSRGNQYPRSLFEDFLRLRDEVNEYGKLSFEYISSQTKLEEISSDQIIARTLAYIKDVCTTTSYWEKYCAEQGWTYTKSKRIKKEAYKKFKCSYNIRTRHLGEFDSKQFRANVEFIYDIPSLTKDRKEEIIAQIEKDIAIIGSISELKEQMKKMGKRGIQDRLVKIMQYLTELLQDFHIPSLTGNKNKLMEFQKEVEA